MRAARTDNGGYAPFEMAGKRSAEVLTVTLAPAWDVTLWLDTPPAPDGVCRVLRETRTPGGKGLNAARTLEALGVAAHALSPADGTGYQARENVTLRYGGQTWKVNRPAPALSAGSLRRLRETMRRRLRAGGVAAFCGCVPDGMTAALPSLAEVARACGARVALDADGLDMALVRAVAPWLMKPNLAELRRLVPVAGEGIREVAAAARTLCEAGNVEVVLASMGARGLLRVTREDAVIGGVPPAVAVGSTVGAGDSALAGYLAADAAGKSAAECVRYAVACGAACAMREETWASAADVEALLPRVEMRVYDGAKDIQMV